MEESIGSTPCGWESIQDPLKTAIAKLEAGLVQSKADPENKIVRDGVILRFAYTMDIDVLSIRVLLRYFAPKKVRANAARHSLFLEAGRQGLLSNVENWLDYNTARAEILNAYNEEIAQAVFSQAERFLHDVKTLHETLKHGNPHTS